MDEALLSGTHDSSRNTEEMAWANQPSQSMTAGFTSGELLQVATHDEGSFGRKRRWWIVMLMLLVIVSLSVGAYYFLVIRSSVVEVSDRVDETMGVSDTEIVLGSSSALTGHASFLGTQYIHGSYAYLNDVNENGGIHGRKIRLISYDDQYDPPETVANTQRLLNEDRVFALFDYVGTPTSVKIVDIVQNARVPTFGFFTGAEALRTPFRPYIFNVRDSYYAEAEGVIALFVDKLGMKDVAVMYQDDAFGLAVLSGVQLALGRRSMETTITATYKRGSMEVGDAVERIRSSGAEAVVMVGTYSPLAKFIKLAHDQEYFPYFHTVSFVGSEAFGKEIVEVQQIDKEQLEKIVVTQVVPSPYADEFLTVREYRASVAKHYPQDEPNYVALEGYVNAKVLVTALDMAGSQLTRSALIEALESIRYLDMGIGKEVTYGPLDHQGLEGIYYSRVNEDGRFEIFTP